MIKEKRVGEYEKRNSKLLLKFFLIEGNTFLSVDISF